MAHIAQEFALILIAVTVDRAAFPLFLVVTEVALVLPTVVPMYNPSLTMFETIFELPDIQVSGQGAQIAIAFHLALFEETLVNVSVLELQAAFTIKVGGYH